jgi:predicted lipoprotein with Yx(FWY)xxD motif
MTRFLTSTFGSVAALLLSAAAAHAAGMLTASNGMTLYTFDKDKDGQSACYDACAKLWPPYIAKADEKMGEGWTMVKRKDGADQWAYDGKPLYFYQADQKAGDMKGDGFKGVWHIIAE